MRTNTSPHLSLNSTLGMPPLTASQLLVSSKEWIMRGSNMGSVYPFYYVHILGSWPVALEKHGRCAISGHQHSIDNPCSSFQGVCALGYACAQPKPLVGLGRVRRILSLNEGSPLAVLQGEKLRAAQQNIFSVLGDWGGGIAGERDGME